MLPPNTITLLERANVIDDPRLGKVIILPGHLGERKVVIHQKSILRLKHQYCVKPDSRDAMNKFTPQFGGTNFYIAV
jgi:hypothetical protein